MAAILLLVAKMLFSILLALLAWAVPLSIVAAKTPDDEIAGVQLTGKLKGAIVVLAWLGLWKLSEFTWGQS